MVKYFTFAELSTKQLGEFKSLNTMGAHSCEIVKKSETHIVIKGNNKTVILKPNSTLGYNCGEIWVVKPASEIKNKLNRWARENKISLDNIIKTDEPIDFGTSSQICGAGWGITGTQLTYFGGVVEGYDDTQTWIGGKIAYSTKYRYNREFGGTYSYRDTIYIRTNVTDDEGAKILYGLLYPGKTNQKVHTPPETWGEFLEFYNQLHSWLKKKILCLACGREWFDYNYNLESEMRDALSSLPPDTKIPLWDLKNGINDLNSPILIWNKKWDLNPNYQP